MSIFSFHQNNTFWQRLFQNICFFYIILLDIVSICGVLKFCLNYVELWFFFFKVAKSNL